MEFSSDIFVLDNSVLVKCFFNEEGTEKAASFLQGFREKRIRIVLPEFALSEFANTCLKKVRKKIALMSQALRHLNALVELPLEWYRDRELLDVALENGYFFGISVYDALYVSLAEIYMAPLVTADKALYKACHGRFDFIEYLGEMDSK